MTTRPVQAAANCKQHDLAAAANLTCVGAAWPQWSQERCCGGQGWQTKLHTATKDSQPTCTGLHFVEVTLWKTAESLFST